MSTPSLYFNGNPRLDITESEPVADPPQTAYARTKLTNEKELTEASRDGLLTISLRPRAVHGPWDRTITPRILRMASKKKLPLINNGEALTDITYIENLNRAVDCCLRAPSDAWNEVYNISNGEPISIHDWFQGIVGSFGREFRPKNVPLRTAHAIARVMELASRLPVGPSRPLMTRFSVGYMGTSMTMSIDKARKRLGYSPAVSNQEGFRRMAHWFQAHDRSDG